MRVKITHQYTGKPYVYIETAAYNHNSYLHLPVTIIYIILVDITQRFDPKNDG